MAKFQNKYRISSARLQNWDYGSDAAYFITICTQDRIYFFGNIQNGKMENNEIGQIANDIWMTIPQQFSYLELGEFVVMPNHIHGILLINKTSVQTRLIASLSQTSIKPTGGITGNNNPMLHDNISRIMRWYKGRCTYEIRKLNPEFAWQPRFYDHIIRNEISFQRISQYIVNNPQKWREDKFND